MKILWTVWHGYERLEGEVQRTRSCIYIYTSWSEKHRSFHNLMQALSAVQIGINMTCYSTKGCNI